MLNVVQVVGLHPSCGLDSTPEWVLFNEFVLTSRPYIRTVSEVRPEWLVLSVLCCCAGMLTRCRLLEMAPQYYDLSSFPDGETKRALKSVVARKKGKRPEQERDSDSAPP